jgi:nitroreductase
VDDDRLSIKRSPSFLTKYYQGTDDNVNKRVSKRPSFLQELKHLILREDTEDSEDQIVSSKLLSALRWRRTVKSFQHGCIDYSVVIEAATLAPSEFGLTPYRVYVVEDPEMKKKLRASSFSQPQVEEAAVLLYFVVITDPKLATAKLIKKMNYDISSPELALHIRMTYDNQSPEQFTAYARAQAHTALGFAIALAAEQRIASCPIEGFKPARIAKILGLSESELPVVCLALGTQHADPSKAMPLAEARFTADDIVVRTFTM